MPELPNIYRLNPIELHTGRYAGFKWVDVEIPDMPDWIPGIPDEPKWRPDVPPKDIASIPTHNPIPIQWRITYPIRQPEYNGDINAVYYDDGGYGDGLYIVWIWRWSAPNVGWWYYTGVMGQDWDEPLEIDGWKYETLKNEWEYKGPPPAETLDWKWNFGINKWECKFRRIYENGFQWDWDTKEWEFTGRVETGRNGWVWYWRRNEWVYEGQTRKLVPSDAKGSFVPDHLIVFILVYKRHVGTVNWENFNSVNRVKNDIVEIGTLRMGFDEDNYNFAFEDISFKVVNDSGIWEDILSQETVSEIRILRAFPKPTTDDNEPTLYEKSECLFYGIIDKNNITYTINVDHKDNAWIEYREYEFTAYNYLRGLKEVPIMDLRQKLDREIAANRYKAIEGNNKLHVPYFENVFIFPQPKDTSPNFVTFWYIPVVNILKALVEILYKKDIDVTIKSDIRFYIRNNLTNENACWYLNNNADEAASVDNVLMLFKYSPVNKTREETVFYGFWDDDKKKQPAYSFFKFENCFALLEDLLLNFGLVWRVNYEANEQAMWKWDIKFSFTSRFFGNDRNDLIDKIHDDIKGEIQEPSPGVKVTITNSGDITNFMWIEQNRYSSSGEPPVMALERAPATNKMKNITTNFISFQLTPNNKYDAPGYPGGYAVYEPVFQYLFGYMNDNVVAPIDSYVVFRDGKSVATFPMHGERNSVMTNGKLTENSKEEIHKKYFGQMLANYYEGPYGIFSNIKSYLSFTVDTIDVQPLDKVSIANKNYVIMQVEKDFLSGSSKLDLKEYAI